MKKSQFLLLTAACLLASSSWAASEALLPRPVAVLESETFEAVARLEDEGLVWFVDRADSNAPVLGAQLEVESGGSTVKAAFRADTGDYLVADSAWLQALRQPGEHPLAVTLIAGDESDLLAGELTVAAPPVAATAATRGWPLALLAGGVVLAGGWLLRRRGGRS